MYLATAFTATNSIVSIIDGGLHKLSFFFVLLVLFFFLSFVCLCLYNACDNPTLLADTLPARLSYGDI